MSGLSWRLVLATGLVGLSSHTFAVNVVPPVAVSAPDTTVSQTGTTLPPQRLSSALVALGLSNLRFPEGLMWQRFDAVGKQADERQALLRLLQDNLPTSESARKDRLELIDWLAQQPVTGREPLPEADARYLAIHPALDPVLGMGDQLKWTEIPVAIAVLGGTGAPCSVHYSADLPIRSYLQACLPNIELNRVLLVAPTGLVTEVPVSDWAGGNEPVLLPGSYLWVPIPGLREDDQQALARQIGTLGPFRDIGQREPDLLARALIPLPVTSSDFGNVGLLQNPTARMRSAGSVSATLSHALPYTRLNVMLQPFDWLEAGFRYTGINNRSYLLGTTGGQSFKDKSIDLKLRLNKESAYLPELALGLRDLAGTGLFSGEYFVASKRYQQFDFSLGLGWGYFAQRNSMNNPLRVFSDDYSRRSASIAGGGNRTDYFRGPMSPFGGVEWFSQQLPVSIKFEFDSNDYKHEPLGNSLKTSSPFNVGATYRPVNGLELVAALERGNTLSVGFTLFDNIAHQGVLKINDPKPVPVKAARPDLTHATQWSEVAKRIEEQVGARVFDIHTESDHVRVDLSSPAGLYTRPQVEQVGRILHEESPAGVDWFTVGFSNGGLKTQDVSINREALSQQATQWLPLDLRQPVLTAQAPAALNNKGLEVFSQSPGKLNYALSLDYDQILGGPNAFLLFNVDALAKAQYSFSANNWLSGSLSARLFDNFDKFTYDAPSGLPRVRTLQRSYLTDAPVNLRDFQYNHTFQPSEDQHVLLYAGLLERMFAGFGGEWLYRPFGSKVAFGLDINRVQQRGFAQDFSLQGYRVTTGHASMYIDTGIEDILATVKVGQYLAGDRGATVDFSRIFRNGSIMGAYATLTDASSSAYGEGRFTKGIYVQVPFDALLTRSNRNYANFNWSPLTRDGGALLNRAYTLYGLTDMRSPRTLGLTPAGKSDANTPTP